MKPIYRRVNHDSFFILYLSFLKLYNFLRFLQIIGSYDLQMRSRISRTVPKFEKKFTQVLNKIRNIFTSFVHFILQLRISFVINYYLLLLDSYSSS